MYSVLCGALTPTEESKFTYLCTVKLVNLYPFLDRFLLHPYWKDTDRRMRRMRSSLMVRASDCQCTSCNGPGFDPSIRQHSGIWGAADEAVLNIVWKRIKNPQKYIEKKKRHSTENSKQTFPEKKMLASVPISSLMCLWAIDIFPGSVCLFCCRKICEPILGICKSLTDTWMWKLGLRSRSSFSGNT